MSGSAFAILGALVFAFCGITIRRSVIKIPDASLGVLINVPTGLLFFLLILIATDQIGHLGDFTWRDLLYFSAAGILQLAVYRSFMFNCIKLVGANVTSALRRIRTLVAVILGIGFLGEPLSLNLITGVLLIVFGVTLTGLGPQSFTGGKGISANTLKKTLLFGFLGGLAGGTSPILIKMGLSDSASPLGGAFISHLAATIILCIPLTNPVKRKNLRTMPATAVGLFMLNGVLAGSATLLRYLALKLSPASVVSPLFSISPIFLLGLSFLFNRKIEIFSRFIVIGIITVVIGSILLI